VNSRPQPSKHQARERLVFLGCAATALTHLADRRNPGLLITRGITQPLAAIGGRSKALARGEFDHQFRSLEKMKLAELGRVFNDTASRLQKSPTPPCTERRSPSPRHRHHTAHVWSARADVR